jgi:hypothetical protein
VRPVDDGSPRAATGPQAPQGGVEPPPDVDRLERQDASGTTATVWWLGVHGGAGETTLAGLLDGSRAAEHRWPTAPPEHPSPRVVLVARSSARGLRAAQRAAADWASGSTGVELLGLVVVADAPGRLPRPLRDLAALVKGGVPHAWDVPWVESWRLGEDVSVSNAPRPVRRVLHDLNKLVIGSASQETP